MAAARSAARPRPVWRRGLAIALVAIVGVGGLVWVLWPAEPQPLWQVSIGRRHPDVVAWSPTGDRVFVGYDRTRREPSRLLTLDATTGEPIGPCRLFRGGPLSEYARVNDVLLLHQRSDGSLVVGLRADHSRPDNSRDDRLLLVPAGRRWDAATFLFPRAASLRLVVGPQRDGTVSPDGCLLAYASDLTDVPGRQLVVIDLEALAVTESVDPALFKEPDEKQKPGRVRLTSQFVLRGDDTGRYDRTTQQFEPTTPHEAEASTEESHAGLFFRPGHQPVVPVCELDGHLLTLADKPDGPRLFDLTDGTLVESLPLCDAASSRSLVRLGATAPGGWVALSTLRDRSELGVASGSITLTLAQVDLDRSPPRVTKTLRLQGERSWFLSSRRLSHRESVRGIVSPSGTHVLVLRKRGHHAHTTAAVYELP